MPAAVFSVPPGGLRGWLAWFRAWGLGVWGLGGWGLGGWGLGFRVWGVGLRVYGGFRGYEPEDLESN